MEVDEIRLQSCKRSKIGHQKGNEQYQDEDDEDGEVEGERARLQSWRSSRIYRVSRSSGGKDRHSKVVTAKGLRDRRVRLSVSTAIQFYDLQDRLGYDQPSKAVEWLIKAAADAITELPPLDGAFYTTPKQPSDTKPPLGIDQSQQQQQQQQQHVSMSKSACSSTSETSKGSVLSLTRSEIRVKARERARERTAKEKEPQHNITQSSFTELLTGAGAQQNPNPNLAHKPTMQHMHSTALNYFGGHFGNPHHLTQLDQEVQQFSFLPDQIIANDYNLNFSMSPGIAGFGRGTLQSNLPSLLPHIQRLSSSSSSPVDGTNLPFYAAATAAMENQFPAGFDGRLQLCYGDGRRHSDVKGKGKS
eukprot:TRINITY_DN1895_c1_g1_i1.p1 TRINITY_DN1895_c1_g1~~TRINITY_DN1895_c1_g1_i1.p1  ORF type:complete len:360 (+),score=36.73 TRINITY_DN1895_c1_g1_i1:794-1873(+)